MSQTKQIWRTWGARFRALVRAKGKNLATVAERLGRSEPALRSWTNGHREINLSEFFDLCEAAEVDPAIVLFGPDLLSLDQKQSLGDLLVTMLNPPDTDHDRRVKPRLKH